MQAHVKTPHIKIDIKGDIHPKILSVLKELYGKKVKFIKDKDDEYVNILETDWYKKINSEMTPGKIMKIYREIHKITQEDLGKKMGGISKQNISHMERGIRSISKSNAKVLSKIFNVPVDRFI
ncbi:MAG: XRE family transcriptional regulator [Spirochaetae bacterium HGW-Spirochaetae-1]|jgi:DNA-binding XRE family transcriptional regulator|nr:MAG: XRE family transcriptional regulator [Spirochaetae bacterium HGW-Spirochaetae-1]